MKCDKHARTHTHTHSLSLYLSIYLPSLPLSLEKSPTLTADHALDERGHRLQWRTGEKKGRDVRSGPPDLCYAASPPQPLSAALTSSADLVCIW
jgi:hypothetical protein